MEQVQRGRVFLGAVSGTLDTEMLIEEVHMDAVHVPDHSPASGRTLGDLSPARSHGVQIAGIRRGMVRILNPAANEELRAADELLVLGTPEQIRGFRGWLTENTASES